MCIRDSFKTAYYASDVARALRDRPSVARSARSLFGVAPPMHGLNVFGMVISPASSHTFRVSMCDLKHNFAVWQRYALNDLDVPIDCGLNACRGHPQNLAFLSNNRK